MALWKAALPHVTPHYAVKCNNDPQILRWLASAGAAFDCASPREMREVFRAGAKPTDVIYAHPCKSVADVKVAQRFGIQVTVVDSPEEVVKLAAGGWRGSTLIRLLVPDAGSAQPFSKKFGAPLDWVPEITRLLRAAGIRHSGYSFHVGSECQKPAQFATALRMCAEAPRPTGPEIIDVGGGFLPDREAFEAAAHEISAQQHLFAQTTKWIGEPGRFLAQPAATLRVQVTGIKPRVDGTGWRYTLDETIYGAFSNIPFDGQRPAFRLDAPDSDERSRVRATLFGRTCDSADCLAEDIEMPELRLGDWLVIDNMGAYTTVTASEFNGFPQPKRIYEPPPTPKNRELRTVKRKC